MERRKFLQNSVLLAGSVGAASMLKYMPARAAGSDTLIVAQGHGINSLDIHREGTNRPSYTIAVNCYDRLLSFGTKTLPDGTLSYDYETLVPEAAESWEVADDNMSITFHMRKGATFWDGSPITAHDVKWSLDRAVSVGGFPTVQMEAGSLEKTEQFVVVDDMTLRIDLLRESKLTLPDLAVPVPMIINSELAKKHATEDDPWATDYLHRNPAGSGAFKPTRWDPGEQVVLERFDDWKNGELPGVKRVILREVPSMSTRRALLERGDSDLMMDVPPKHGAELAAMDDINVAGVPIENTIYAVGLNTGMKPFDDKRVRQAVAYAIPYQRVFEDAAYKRGAPLWGADSAEPATADWPQPFPYDTDLEKARELMAQAGYEDGVEVPFSINLGLAHWMEPTALLIQENLAKIGMETPINKIPGAKWRTKALVEESLPLHLKTFGGWLNYPDYYFFWAYIKGHLFNSMQYHNDTIEKLVDETLHMPTDDPQYSPNIKQMIRIAFDEVPLIPLWQPNLDMAMRNDVHGYEHWFHRQLDCRSIYKKT